MDRRDWFKRVAEFIGTIEEDADLSDDDCLEVLEALESQAGDSLVAKRESMGDEDDDDYENDDDDDEDEDEDLP